MEQAQLDVVTPEHLDQRDFRLVEFPAGSQETAILVAVRIAEHDLLHAGAAFQQAQVFGETQQLIHDSAAMAQILDCLEQRDDIEIERAVVRPQKTSFFQKHSGFENVGDTGRFGNHIMRNRGRAVPAMRLGSRVKNCDFALGLGRIGKKGGRQRARRRQLHKQQPDALRLGKSGVIKAWLHEAEHLADRALVHVRVLTQIERGEMKAEDIDRTAQVLQTTLGQDLGAIGDKRAVKD
jgi:hypothetical protein